MTPKELVGRLSVLGIPPEVTNDLTVSQIRAIHAVLGEWLADVPEAGIRLHVVPPD